jgi:hypothetical protein
MIVRGLLLPGHSSKRFGRRVVNCDGRAAIRTPSIATTAYAWRAMMDCAAVAAAAPDVTSTGAI